jgi:hypothetical protein
MPNQEELDRLLYRLIAQVLNPSSNDDEKVQARKSVISLTSQLPGILTQKTLDIGLRIYYDDAVIQTEEGIERNIKNFPQTYKLELSTASPSRLRKCWVRYYNLILKRKCIDLWRRKRNKRPLELDGLPEGIEVPDPGLIPMEVIIEEENKKIYQKIKDYLEKDPDGELQGCLVKRNRNYSCWDLIKRRILKQPPDKWQDIVKEFNGLYGNITSDWHRYCNPLLKSIPAKFGY